MCCVHGGYALCPWRSIINHCVSVSDGLEMSHFWSYTQDGLEMSQMVLKGVTCGW